MTEKQRSLFLAELSRTGNVAFACAAADVSRATAYEYRDSSPSFEQQWRDAATKARLELERAVREWGREGRK